MMRFDGEWFTFLKHDEVEPANNTAERALKPVVLKRKVSQQSRGADNMKGYAMQAFIFMTLKHQGRSYLQYLNNLLLNQSRSNKS
jgi:hypothetical protein